MSSDLDEDDSAAYEADAVLGQTPEQAAGSLARLTQAANQQQEAAAALKAAEAAVKVAKERLLRLEELTLVELMTEARQLRCTTEDGLELKLRETVRASVPEAMIPKASLFLEGAGHGAIVKHELKLSFGRGEAQRAERAFQMLREAGFAPSDKIVIHPQSLAAAVTEMLKKGVAVPMATLGVHIQKSVKVTVPK